MGAGVFRNFLISEFAQFLLEISKFLMRNTSIIWETYFVKQEYFSFFGHDILEFHALFYNSII
jgi:methionyl-tRNA synthetase